MNDKSKKIGFPGKSHDGNKNYGNRPKEDKKISLEVIVSGTATEVDANPKQKLKVIVEKALYQTGNTGREITSWTLKTREGAVLELDQTVEDYDLKDGTQLILSLQAGAGGC